MMNSKSCSSRRVLRGSGIVEATNISPKSLAFEHAPGIWTKDQVKGWQSVTSAVHRENSACKIFCQIWHAGRIGSKYLNGVKPLSPSGINTDLDQLQVWGKLDNGAFTRIYATDSQAMTVEDIDQVIHEYGVAAKNSMEAGFDGIEIHAANGYLLHQFLASSVNTRTDEYGGSAENRVKLLRKVIEEVKKHVPVAKIGVRISPFALYNNARDDNPHETFGCLAELLQEMGIGYLHVCDFNAVFGPGNMKEILEIVKPKYKGVIIGNGGISPEKGDEMIETGQVDMISFGRLFISNPDLVERIQSNGPFNKDVGYGYYGGDERGYNDYPKLK